MEKAQKQPMTGNEMPRWSSSDDEEHVMLPDFNHNINESEFDKTVNVDNLNASASASTRLEESDSSSLVPNVGMKFDSETAAYDFYNDYARRSGFSIKKYHVERRKDGSLKFRKFCCSKQGFKQQHRTHVTVKPLPDTRTNCMARVEFKIDLNGVWLLSKIVLDHNHPMTSPNKAHMLRSHRRMQSSQHALIDQMLESGIKAHHIYNYLQSGVTSDKAGFTRDDNANNIQRYKRNKLSGKEIRGILKYLKDRQAKDHSFFYAIEAHESGEIAHFFWADGRSILDYSHFGDVVCFDTTFQTNAYDMPFAPIVGINHHKQIIIFGTAILSDETADSFIWLFETFLQAMSGRHPVTILTDQSATISKAIETVFPQTAHRFCLWHVFNNVATNLSHVLHDSTLFLSDFKVCVYNRCSVDVFEKQWEDLLNKYNLGDNSWMINFFKLRSKWAACYRIETFSAEISQRSESMNHHFKSFFRKSLGQFDLLEQYDKALSYFRENELKADFKSRNSAPNGVFGNMCREAAAIYTRVIYEEFAKEFIAHLDCYIDLINADNFGMTYKITPLNHGRDELVTYNPSTVAIKCTCKMFESNGILCMHAIRVLVVHNVNYIPKQYILQRWKKYAREGDDSITSPPTIDSSGKESLTSLYSRVRQNQYSILTMSMHSRQALEHIVSATNQLRIDVHEILRTETQPDEVPTDNDDSGPEPNFTIELSVGKKGRKEKRKKGVFEQRPKKTNATRVKDSISDVHRPPTSTTNVHRPPISRPTVLSPHVMHNVHRPPIITPNVDYAATQVPMSIHPIRPASYPFFSYPGMVMGTSAFYCADAGSQLNPTQQQTEDADSSYSRQNHEK